MCNNNLPVPLADTISDYWKERLVTPANYNHCIRFDHPTEASREIFRVCVAELDWIAGHAYGTPLEEVPNLLRERVQAWLRTNGDIDAEIEQALQCSEYLKNNVHDVIWWWVAVEWGCCVVGLGTTPEDALVEIDDMTNGDYLCTPLSEAQAGDIVVVPCAHSLAMKIMESSDEDFYIVNGVAQ